MGRARELLVVRRPVARGASRGDVRGRPAAPGAAAPPPQTMPPPTKRRRRRPVRRGRRADPGETPARSAGDAEAAAVATTSAPGLSRRSPTATSAVAGFNVPDPDVTRAHSAVGTAYGVVNRGNEAPSIADHAANTAIGTIAASTKRVARCGPAPPSRTSPRAPTVDQGWTDRSADASSSRSRPASDRSKGGKGNRRPGARRARLTLTTSRLDITNTASRTHAAPNTNPPPQTNLPQANCRHPAIELVIRRKVSRSSNDRVAPRIYVGYIEGVPFFFLATTGVADLAASASACARTAARVPNFSLGEWPVFLVPPLRGVRLHGRVGRALGLAVLAADAHAGRLGGDGDGERGARGGHRGGGEADEGDAAALRGDADATTARRA